VGWVEAVLTVLVVEAEPVVLCVLVGVELDTVAVFVTVAVVAAETVRVAFAAAVLVTVVCVDVLVVGVTFLMVPEPPKKVVG
jgi:hypothetical protein